MDLSVKIHRCLKLIICFSLLQACQSGLIIKEKPKVVEPSVNVSHHGENLSDKKEKNIKVAPQNVQKIGLLTVGGNRYYNNIVTTAKEKINTPLEVFYIGRNPKEQADLLQKVQGSSVTHVVAIGASAVKQAEKLNNKTVITCQTFHYQSDNGFSGVSMIPSAEQLFKKWRELSPSLKRVAILTGAGHEKLIEKLAGEARSAGVIIVHRVVSNDRAMVLEAQKLEGQVQGFWLLPDHRIMSVKSIKAFLNNSVKSGKQVAVFNHDLLQYGGFLAVEIDNNELVNLLIRQIEAPTQEILRPAKAKITLNPVAAKRLKIDQ